jgi:hypothetical protein
LALRYTVTQGKMLERLVDDDEIVFRLDPASSEWTAYFIVTA